MIDTSEESLSIETNCVPAGGIMTRNACGPTIFDAMSHRGRPSAMAASRCPPGTDRIPLRTVSDR